VHLASGGKPAATATREAGAVDLADERAGVTALGAELGGWRTEHREMTTEVGTDCLAEEAR
jgi:hypothetical protein